MFNIEKIQPAFSSDSYGFTEKLISYIDGESDSISDNALLRLIINKAWVDNCREAQKVLQHTLFIIYQCSLSHPLSYPARLQFDPLLVNMKSQIEESWLSYEAGGIEKIINTSAHQSFGDYLKDVWKAHNASHHILFDFLESDATKEQVYYFFKSDSALNLIFFDLVAYTLIGAQPETRGTISENLWDEIGHGDNVFTHVNLYKEVLARQDIKLPENHYIDMYGVEALAGHNAFMIGSVNRKHYYKLLGVMAMTELLDPPQYEKLIKGCMRLGLIEKDVKYYAEHITIDIKHGDDWLYKVINVIAGRYTQSKEEFYQGSLLRLNTAEKYYDQLFSKIKEM